MIGSLVSGSVDTLLACSLLVKNALGAGAVLLVAGVLVSPLLDIMTLQIAFRISAAIMEPVADSRLTKGISALADVLSGYMTYAPATLVIKAVMALVAAMLYRGLKKHSGGVLVCGVMGEIPMVVGYWLFEAWMMKSLVGAAVGIPGNLVQASFGVAASTLLVLALRKSGYVRARFPRL